MNKHVYHGIIGGLISGISGVIYSMIYQKLMFLDFNSVLSFTSIIIGSTLSCCLMATAYWSLEKKNMLKFKGVANIIIGLLTFFSIIVPLSITLPLDIDFPELYPGLAVPIHFFPALIFFGLTPFFDKPISDVQ